MRFWLSLRGLTFSAEQPGSQTAEQCQCQHAGPNNQRHRAGQRIGQTAFFVHPTLRLLLLDHIQQFLLQCNLRVYLAFDIAFNLAFEILKIFVNPLDPVIQFTIFIENCLNIFQRHSELLTQFIELPRLLFIEAGYFLFNSIFGLREVLLIYQRYCRFKVFQTAARRILL